MTLDHVELNSQVCIKIETYWNVNPMAFAKCDYIDKIKIETYWNVNWQRGKRTISICLLK